MSNGNFLLNPLHWKNAQFDERFILHRYKSTRLAVLAGCLVILALFTYYGVARKTVRWDLFAIALAMAVTKLCAMAYYQRRE